MRPFHETDPTFTTRAVRILHNYLLPREPPTRTFFWADVFTVYVATDSRTIRLDDDVYERLAAEKRTDESFSDAVERLLGDDNVLDLYGKRAEQGTEDLREAIGGTEASNRERVEELRDRAQSDG